MNQPVVALHVWLLLLTSAVADETAIRTWRDVTGKFEVRAALVGARHDSKTRTTEVTLRKGDGTVIVVPIDRLCETDRTIIQREAIVRKPRTDSQGRSAPGEDAMRVTTWAALIDTASSNPNLAAERDTFLATAKKIAAREIVKRVYEFEDIGKHRSVLKGLARQHAGTPRQKCYALALSDYPGCETINDELPVLSAAYRLSKSEMFRARIIAQLEETSTWSPLQRPGWSLIKVSAEPIPAGFNDGSWMATGYGVRALVDTLEIMPPGSLPQPLVEKIESLLRKEIASTAEDWLTKRSWFIKNDNVRTNQWVLPTEGLIRACLAVGKDKCPAEYELGVRNLLAAMDAQGEKGEYYEGIQYAIISLESMLHAAHAMAVAGDMRGLNHRFLNRFPAWMVHNLQPGWFRINCFDSINPKADPTDHEFRGLLSLFSVLNNDPVARWALANYFSGPSDDFVGLLARSTRGESRDPGCFASYDSACRINWRSSWAEDASGIWIRGGHPLDFHDHFDRGHVNFILKGKPILIEAGTPHYGNPSKDKLCSTVLGHNVLEISGSAAKKMPAPITVVRLDQRGGEAVVDPTACYPELKQWQRRVNWETNRLDVEDEVVFPEGQSGAPIFRWHLGTQEQPVVNKTGTKVTALWSGVRMTWVGSIPLLVTSETMPDYTIRLGEKIEGNYLHRCLIVRTERPVSTCNIKTELVATRSPVTGRRK